MRGAGRLDRRQADEAADAVVDVDDEVAGRQRADFLQDVCRARLCFLRGADEAVAEDVLFADDGEIAGDESLLEADAPRARRCRGQRLRQRRDGLRLSQSVFRQNVAKPLARPVRPARDDHALAVALQRVDVADDGFEHIDVLVARAPARRSGRPAPRSTGLPVEPSGMANGVKRASAAAVETRASIVRSR